MQTIKWSADNKRRYASREGSIPPVLLSEVSKGAYPLAHDFPLGKSSVLYLSGADGSRKCVVHPGKCGYSCGVLAGKVAPYGAA